MSSHAQLGLLVGAALSSACSAYKPPAPPTPREATEVAASMGNTWDAVIDMFAARNIPIRTIERASGIIATDQLSVGDEGWRWADCGQHNGTTLSPDAAIYNVLVRGDSTSAVVKATVRWTRTNASAVIECSTSHVWERELETAVKAQAQAHQAEAPQGTPSASPRPDGLSPPTYASAGTAPPAGAGPPAAAGRGLRSGVELLGEATFATAVSELQSLGALQGFGETGRDTLTVQLTDSGIRSLAIRHYLRRLFYAYRYANELRTDTLLLLTHGGRIVATYSESGMEKRDWR
jgi:hypothetical protein